MVWSDEGRPWTPVVGLYQMDQWQKLGHFVHIFMQIWPFDMSCSLLEGAYDNDDVDLAVEATECDILVAEVFDLIRNIQDPEKPETLEELQVVHEDWITVHNFDGHDDEYLIKIELVPTVPHCSLATLIGLCVRTKLQQRLDRKYKLDIHIKEGTHSTAKEINKQINDKERTAAAMENPSLRELVENCIKDQDFGEWIDFTKPKRVTDMYI